MYIRLDEREFNKLVLKKIPAYKDIMQKINDIKTFNTINKITSKNLEDLYKINNYLCNLLAITQLYDNNDPNKLPTLIGLKEIIMTPDELKLFTDSGFKELQERAIKCQEEIQCR